jgi:hypothetical protein
MPQKNLSLNSDMLNIRLAAFTIYRRHRRGQQCRAATVNSGAAINISQAYSGADQKYQAEDAEPAGAVPGALIRVGSATEIRGKGQINFVFHKPGHIQKFNIANAIRISMDRQK